jgi:hypothetical protein
MRPRLAPTARRMTTPRLRVTPRHQQQVRHVGADDEQNDREQHDEHGRKNNFGISSSWNAASMAIAASIT